MRTDAEVLRNCTNLDANESAFFARQLEYIKPKTYDILYPEYKAFRLMAVSTEAGPGAQVIRLLAENPGFAPIELKDGQELRIWGVVTFNLHRLLGV